jgi:hypothetical protein
VAGRADYDDTGTALIHSVEPRLPGCVRFVFERIGQVGAVDD